MQEETLYITPCATCCQINYNNKKSLPLYCPAHNRKICDALKNEVIKKENGRLTQEFIDYVHSLPQPMKCMVGFRVPLNSEYINMQYVKDQMLTFEALQKSGVKKIYTMRAY